MFFPPLFSEGISILRIPRPPDGRRPGRRGARSGRQRTGRHRHPGGAVPAAARSVRSPPCSPTAASKPPSAPAGAFSTFTTGQSIGPWTVTAGSVDLIGPGFWAAADGDQSLDLDGTSAGTVSQTFATTPGTTYTVSYALAGNPARRPGPEDRQGPRSTARTPQDFSFDNHRQDLHRHGLRHPGIHLPGHQARHHPRLRQHHSRRMGTRPRQHPAAHHLLQAILQLTKRTVR